MKDLNNIIEQVKQSNQDAFRDIIREFGPLIRVYLSSYISDFRDVEELSQETFVAIYWNLDSYDPKLSFQTWLKAIARNKLMSFLRRQYSQKNIVHQLREEITQNLPAPDIAPHHKTNPAIEQLQSCLEKLSENSAALVDARYYQRESVMDIAQRLQATEDAISSRLYRIRLQLKQCIQQGLEA